MMDTEGLVRLLTPESSLAVFELDPSPHHGYAFGKARLDQRIPILTIFMHHFNVIC